jgi:DNA-binding Lrp family transcriptional regulator
MKDITGNEMKVLIALFKDFNTRYNANNLSKTLSLTSMGTLKILKKMEKQNILKSEQIGKAVFYKPNLEGYPLTYLTLLLQKEAEDSLPRIKRWVKEFRKLESVADFGILFGSVISKDNANDIDFFLVTNQKQNNNVNKTVSELQRLTTKKIHVVKQTKEDLITNLKQKNKVLLEIIKKGIVLFGYDKLIEVIKFAA